MGGGPPKQQIDAVTQGEPDLDEQERTQEDQPTEEELASARTALSSICSDIGLPVPDEAVTAQAAKIVREAGEDGIQQDMNGNPNRLWLLTESYTRLGMDTAPISEAGMQASLGAVASINRELPPDSPEAIREQIVALEGEVEMPLPQEPKEGASAEEIFDYRKQLAARHVREALGKRDDESYKDGGMRNLNEFLTRTISRNKKEFPKLRDALDSYLKGTGAQTDGFLSGVTDGALDGMIHIIAKSDADIKRQTAGEEQFPDYVAEDRTTRMKIIALHRRLPN